MGPTASGKSAVAETVAREKGLQLLSADAFMVYRGLDIGTNKPKNKHDYELLDIVDPQAEFGVGEWVRQALALLKRLHDQNKGAVVVGGTGLYVRALFEQYTDLKPAPDPALREHLEERERKEGLETLAQELKERAPETAQQTDLKNPVRVRRALERLADPRPPIKIDLPPFNKLKFVLDPPTETLEQAIEARLDHMLEAGWKHEVERLLEQGVPKSAPAFRAIGYDSVIGLTEGRLTEDEARARIATETRQYAKRQRTWLRTEPQARVLHLKDAHAATATIMDCLV